MEVYPIYLWHFLIPNPHSYYPTSLRITKISGIVLNSLLLYTINGKSHLQSVNVRNSATHLTISSFSVTGLWKPIFLQVTDYSLLNQAFYFTSPLGNRKLMKVNYLLHRPTPTNFLCSPYCYIYTLPYVKESSLTYSTYNAVLLKREFCLLHLKLIQIVAKQNYGASPRRV